VLLQVLPSEAYNADNALAHGRLYAREFAKAGISTDRYCLKIPCTGPALVAARILESEGIRTLGTALFGLPQAIACSQAGCLSISPYYNGRIEAAPLIDPAAEHPMSPRLIQILDAYKRLYAQTGREQPLMKLAR
jgi:transaldolase